MALGMLYRIFYVQTYVLSLILSCTSKIKVHVSQKESAPAFGRGSHRKSISLEYFQAIDDEGHWTWLDIPVVEMAWLCASGVSHILLM